MKFGTGTGLREAILPTGSGVRERPGRIGRDRIGHRAGSKKTSAGEKAARPRKRGARNLGHEHQPLPLPQSGWTSRSNFSLKKIS